MLTLGMGAQESRDRADRGRPQFLGHKMPDIGKGLRREIGKADFQRSSSRLPNAGSLRPHRTCTGLPGEAIPAYPIATLARSLSPMIAFGKTQVPLRDAGVGNGSI